MGHRPGLGAIVRDRYVVPLLAAFELMIHYADARGAGLAALLREQLARPAGEELLSMEALGRLLADVAQGSAVRPADAAASSWSDGLEAVDADLRERTGVQPRGSDPVRVPHAAPHRLRFRVANADGEPA